MPVVISTKNDDARRSISIHQPEKCGTQNTRILLLETEPYKGNFVYEDNLFSTWNSFTILRNHFDRLLSVWYHGCVDPRNQTGKPRAVWGTHENDTFRDFLTRIAKGLYAKDIHVLPYTASHQREFYSFEGAGSKFANDVQVCNYIAPLKWSARATYLRLENMNSIFPLINKWLGLPADTCKELWGSDLKGNHHIKYGATTNSCFADKTVKELMAHQNKHGVFPHAKAMWDDEAYTLIEDCEAYKKDDEMFSALGLLARHDTDDYTRGATSTIEVSNPQHQLWKQYSEIFEVAAENWHPALDEIWESFRKEPYFWPAAVVGQPEFWWTEVNKR